MRFSTVFAAVAVVASGVSAATFSSESITTALTLSSQNHYGAPIPPWQQGHYPGWYYGKAPPSGVLCILEGLLCELLNLLHLGFYCPKPPKPPHYPPPPPEFSQTFYNLTCASQDGSTRLTVSWTPLLAMCDSVSGCTFFNTYHDVNGKGGSTQLTCSLFTTCLTADTADNCGGQGQPDGSVDYIINSDGYCKAKPTA
ncbi:hypothetical protein B0H13DRAFT_2670185 [Mycena leptocephala]|nr:hypothetical protein B0H13DRAFT_2670185 [Mycena leptocephala]